MNHISLYRKYRPATFEEVEGQEHVTRTLVGAISTGKVSHAYLFAGSRGTGKTSTAKLLAKSLNCVDGPTAMPCGKCESCGAIGAGSSLDVIEMDAASNRGIDDIRDIRDRVAFAAVDGKYRVYILDEAHMLTKEASNAFLKVLEEPPPHVIFVLCTTEAHKVLPTIQSRCQRFEFRRPDAGLILKVLRRVAAAEEIEIDDAGLAAIARSSGGAFRDAIGALDQLATFCEKKVSLADVMSLLGAVETELLFEAVDIVADGDAAGALLFIDRLAGSGREFGRFAQELIGHLRHIFLLQQLDEAQADIVNLSGEELQRLKGQARRMPPAQVFRFVELLLEAAGGIKQGGDPRLQVELAFIRMARPQIDTSTKSLIHRIEQLEERLRVAGAPPPTPTRTSKAGAREAPENYQAGNPAKENRPAGEITAGLAPDRSQAPEPPASPDGLPDPDGTPAGGAAEIELSLDRIARAWSVILDQVKKRKIPLYSVLKEGRPLQLEGDHLTISFSGGSEFQKSHVEKPDNIAVLSGVLEEITGKEIGISCVVSKAAAAEPSPRDAGGVPTTEDVITMIKEEFSAEEI
ncbi:MAG: DNA polymerase III subunit gamma/tau [Thermoleophilia bacterium]|nr:DNA polymerase III subunit gamma/tau [Thermoleophilia bacterium]